MTRAFCPCFQIGFLLVVIISSAYAQTPYGGTPLLLPARIQAENYDLGGQGVAYSDVVRVFFYKLKQIIIP